MDYAAEARAAVDDLHTYPALRSARDAVGTFQSGVAIIRTLWITTSRRRGGALRGRRYEVDHERIEDVAPSLAKAFDQLIAIGATIVALGFHLYDQPCSPFVPRWRDLCLE